MTAAPPQVLARINVVRPPGRVAYAGLAAALLASAVALVVVWDAAWWQTVAFALGPDLAVLYGIAPGLARGQLHPRAVYLYNALHRFGGRSHSLSRHSPRNCRSATSPARSAGASTSHLTARSDCGRARLTGSSELRAGERGARTGIALRNGGFDAIDQGRRS